MSDVFIIIISLVTGYMDICFGNLAASSTDWLQKKSFFSVWSVELRRGGNSLDLTRNDQ